MEQGRLVCLISTATVSSTLTPATKLLRSRSTGRTLGFDPGNFGSNPNSAANFYGGVAQLAEQTIDSCQVASSNLAATKSRDEG